MKDRNESIIPKSVRLIPVSELVADEAQPRKTFDPAEMEALKHSIEVVGVLQPLIARRVGGRLVIIDGHRRWIVAVELGLVEVPVIVNEESLSEDSVTLQQLATYCRSDLNPIDRSDAIQRVLRASGGTACTIAREIGLSEGHVSKLLALQLLSDTDKQRLRDGTLGMAEAYRRATGKTSTAPGAVTVDDAPGATQNHPRSRRSAPPVRLKVGDGVTLVASASATASLHTVISELASLLSRLGQLQSEGHSTPDAFAALDDAASQVTPEPEAAHA